MYAKVAQLVEHVFRKDGVASSILAFGSHFYAGLYSNFNFSNPRCTCTAIAFCDWPVIKDISLSDKSCTNRIFIIF